MSTKKENSISKGSGEGRTFTTDAREGGKDAGPGRLRNPGPEHGPESGSGEVDPEGGENHCTDAQGGGLLLVRCLLDVATAGFVWRDYARGCPSDAPLDASLRSSLNALQQYLGEPWNRFAADRLASDLGEIAGQAMRAAELERQLRELRISGAAVTRAADLRQKRIDELAAHLDRAHTEATELSSKVDALTAERDALTAELERQLRELRTSGAIVPNILNPGTYDITAHLDRAHTEATELTGKVDALTAERDALSEELEGLRATAGQWENADTEAAGRVAALEREVGDLRSTVYRQSQQNAELSRERTGLRLELLSTLGEWGAFAAEVNARTGELASELDETEALRAEAATLRNRYADLERDASAMRAELAEWHRSPSRKAAKS